MLRWVHFSKKHQNVRWLNTKSAQGVKVIIIPLCRRFECVVENISYVPNVLAGHRVNIAFGGVVAAVTQGVLRVVCDGVLHHAEGLGRCAEHIVAKLLEYVTLSLTLACLLKLYCCFVALPIVRRVIYPARKAEYQE